MEFKILGPLEILSSAPIPHLHRVKERCLLAIFLMAPNTVHRTETLVQQVWDGDPPKAVERTLRAYMTRVRDVVDAEGDGSRLKAGSGGYQLSITPETVDLHRFRRLLKQADAIAKSGDISQAVALLTEAEGLWRGTALAGLSGRWMEGIRYSLEEERRLATFKRVELELDLGHHAELSGELQRLSTQFPLDESCVAFQMIALYRSGRQADALALYMETCGRFRELGIEPGAGLSSLQQRILRQDPDLVKIPANRSSAQPPLPLGLPEPAGEFVGREQELRELVVNDASGPTVRIITGMAGVGKTALALQAAKRLEDRYPDGQLYLTCHAHAAGKIPLNPSQVLRKLLEMIGVTLTPQPRSTRELATLWRREITTRKFLVILDDVPSAEIIRVIAPAASSSLVLVTARQRLLGIPPAVTIKLDVLPEADAIKLFAQIAGLEKANDSNSVVKVVRLCGCLPLAITLTATRLQTDKMSTVSAFIADVANLRAFPDGLGGASKQLMSAFELSYQGLASDEKVFFRHLGMNPCVDFTVYSAAAIAEVDVIDSESMLGRLLDRHLVERAGGRRFRFHDLVRSYAQFCGEREDSRRERRLAERRLLNYLLHGVNRACIGLYSRGLPREENSSSDSLFRSEIVTLADAQTWLDAELPNLLNVIEYAAKHEWKKYAAELAHAMSEFLDVGGRWDDAIAVHSRALQACRDLGDIPGTARAALALSLASQRRGRHSAALEHAADALKTYQMLGDGRGRALAADRMGMVQFHSGKFRQALAYDEEARDLYRQVADQDGEAEATFHAGLSCLNLGRLEQSMDYLHAALLLFGGTGRERGKAKVLNSMADIKKHQGYHREAIGYYRQALDIYQLMDARQEQAAVMQNMCSVYLYKGDPEWALAEFRRVLAVYHESRDLARQSYAMCDIGDAYQMMELYGEALIHYENANRIAEQIDDLYVRVIALRGIADAHSGSGSRDRAMESYGEALKLAYEIEDPYQQARILGGIAETMIRAGDIDAGRIYLRQACDLYRLIGSIEAQTVEIRLQALSVDYRAS